MRALAIIPNEEKLNVPPFYRDILDNDFHARAIEDFCNKYNLGVTAESLGLEKGDYGGITWQKKLASMGHLVVCHGYPIVVYLPQAVSLNQFAWFQDYKLYFRKNKKNLSYMVIGTQEEILESDDVYSKNNTFRLLYDTLEKCQNRNSLMQNESEELKR